MRWVNRLFQSHRRGSVSPGRYGWASTAILLLLGGLYYALATHFTAVQAFLTRLGPWAPAAFILLYLLLAPLFFPLSLLDFSCGALFGIGRGLAILIVANGLAALEMFVLARWLMATRVSSWLNTRPRWGRFRDLLRRDEWKMLALIRLSPTNFAIVNYLMGAARVRLDHYVLTWLILVPKSLLHVSFGAAVLEVGRTGATNLARTKRLEFLLAAAGLVSLLLLVILVGVRAHQAIEEATRERN